MPQSNKTKRGPSVTPGKHVYRNVRDPLVHDATDINSGTLNYAYAASTNGAFTTQLSPMGVQGLLFSAGAVPSLTLIGSPRMPFLYRTGTNFQEYRVTRATLIVTGQSNNQAYGRFTVSSSTDYCDGAGATASTLNSQFTGGKTYDIASLATKEIRVPLNVSPDWKKVSSRTVSTATAGNGNMAALFTSSANDVIFSFLSIGWTGTVSATNMDAFFSLSVEYDVEFRKPISFALQY